MVESPEASVASPKHNLPAELSSFVGREREIADVTDLLHDSRLLTLSGPGGCGKTRLALRVASQVAPVYADGVFLAELAALTEPGLVPQAVASVLGIHEKPGVPLLETIAGALQARHMLLLLDNCEHLLHACAELAAALLRACPQVIILATSRAPLGVAGEVVWAVPSLAVPEPQPWRSPDLEQDALHAIGKTEAVQLFVLRARATSAAFELTAQNARYVAEICRRLDGLPLAIELAAARIRLLSARQIAERLDDRLRLLTNPVRTAPGRQKTLEAALDWSYQLLSTGEQVLLGRLAVFAGGWTLEAAEAVAAGEIIARNEVLALLSGLVDKSLVAAERAAAGSRRYYLLETIRQYTLAKLRAAGEDDRLRARHLSYYAAWAADTAPEIHDPDLERILARFETEYDNLRAALEWGLRSQQDTASLLRLAALCGDFWNARGYLSEGRAYLARALDLPAAQTRSRLRVRALLASATLAWAQSDFVAARALLEQALEISTELGAPVRDLLATTYCDLGDLLNEMGEYRLAIAYLEYSLSIFRDLNHVGQTAYVMILLGWAAMRQGDLNRAWRYLEESLALRDQLGATQLLGLLLSGLGELAVRQERYEEAQVYLTESLALREALGYPWGTASALGTLGWLALERRDFAQMRDLLQRSIEIRLEIGQLGGVAWCLEKLARAATLEGRTLPAALRRDQWDRAARCAGAASALRRQINSLLDVADLHEYSKLLDELRAGLGEAAFAAACAGGAAAPLDDIVTLALQPPDTRPLARNKALKHKFGGLTTREREAAILIARGLTNRQIAEAMSVSPRTAEAYITRILNKLNLTSRVQIAAWALETGLTAIADDTTQ